MAKSPRKPLPPQKSVSKPTATAAPLPTFLTNPMLASLIIFGLALVLYANTLFNDFTLDDSIVITDNMFTKKGLQGLDGIFSKDTFFGFFKVEGKASLVMGGRYRPFTLAIFALVYQIFGQNAFVFHLLTILLFATTCVVLYRTLRLLLQGWNAQYSNILAFLTTILFAAHPIHTEVVANIKGCDEIVTLLGSVGALYCAIKAYDTGAWKWSAAAFVTFFLACLSKENAVTFVLIVPLALWFFRSNTAAQINTEGLPAPNKGSLLWSSLPIWSAFLIFFVLRGTILHWEFGKTQMELMNNPFLKIVGSQWVPFSGGEKFATILYTLGKYITLLVFPHPLTHDYYPRQIGILSFGNPWVLLSLIVHLGLLVYALTGLGKKDPVRFGMLLYLITLSIVSNLVFPIGTNMGERFVFMPSVGFCLIAAALILRWTQVNTRTALLITGVVATLFSLKTIVRNFDWVSNENLFLTDVKVSGQSAKIRNACGGTLFDKAGRETDANARMAMYRESVVHLDKAIEIYPNYKDAYVTRGGAHFFLKNFDQSIADYRMAEKLSEGDGQTKIKSYLAVALRDGAKYYGEQKQDLNTALRYLNESWEINPTDGETARLFGVANGVQGKHSDAIMWFQRAVDTDPQNASFLFDLGTAYYASGNVAKGEELRAKALQMNPKLLEERGK